VFLAFGFAAHSFNGFPTRFSSKALAFSKVQRHPEFQDNIGLGRVKSGQFMELGSAKSSQPIGLLVWGDSHAMAAAPALDDLCREYSQRGVLSAYSSAPPVLNYVTKGTASREMTPEVAERVVAFISQQHIKNVLLCARWNSYPPTAEFKDALLMTARAIMKAGARVFVLRNVPEPGFNVPRIAALNALRDIDFEALGITKEQHHKSEAALESTFGELTKMGATVIDAADLFLTPRGNYRTIKDGELLYFDSNHLTREGSALLIPLFRPLFQAH